MLWIVTAVFGLMSVLLFMGKGSFLIAGYNTASEKEKAKYNKLRLCRLMGGYMAFLTVFVGLCALYENKLPDKVSRFFPYLFLFLTAAMFILANTVCRAKTTEKKEGESQEEKGNKRAVYGYTRCDSYVVLDTGEKIVAVNGPTQQETEKLYQRISAAIER